MDELIVCGFLQMLDTSAAAVAELLRLLGLLLLLLLVLIKLCMLLLVLLLMMVLLLMGRCAGFEVLLLWCMHVRFDSGHISARNNPLRGINTVGGSSGNQRRTGEYQLEGDVENVKTHFCG